MAHYIDKDALVAEIERRKSELQSRIAELGTFESNTLGLFQEMELYDDIISFLDTLEVKEVDLEKEITEYINKHFHIRYDETLEKGSDPLNTHDFEDIAKHFFELGLKAKQE